MAKSKENLTFGIISEKIRRNKSQFPHLETKFEVKKNGKKIGTITLSIGALGLLTLKNI